MASMASTSSYYCSNNKFHRKERSRVFLPPISVSQKHDQAPDDESPIRRRDMILKSSELATVGAILNFSGKKPNYLGVQKNPPSLALCPATETCISTSENISDLIHYAPPWNYNPGSRKKPVTKEEAKEELLAVIKSTKPDKYTPKVVEDKGDYVRVEYQSPILGFVDDVEFWFPPGKNSIVEYRSASRLWNFNSDIHRKRIKVNKYYSDESWEMKGVSV